jgi:hypothetical protein
MSRNLPSANLPAITKLISRERLAALVMLTDSAEDAIELHQDTLALNASLMNVIASLELALRNSVFENLTAHFGTPLWLTQPPAPFQWRKFENENAKKALDSAQRAAYSKLNQAQKAALDAAAFPQGRPVNTPHSVRAKRRRSQIQVSDGKVIAEVTFYFWKRLFSPDYEQTLWRTTLKRVFPNKTLSRADVAAFLENIYQARNRLAHHEPVLHKRFRETMAAIEFVSENLLHATPTKTTPLANLIAGDLADVRAKAKALHDRLDSFRTPKTP